MRTIIAGSRTASLTNVYQAIELCPWKDDISVVVSGTARGADTYGDSWAKEKNIPIVQYKPDWDGLGKAAGFIRNQQMAENADALILVWDGQSHGSKHMLSCAEKLGLKVYVYHFKSAS